MSRINIDLIRGLFNPESIALIGATDKSRWSSNTFNNLREHGFAGSVHLVNRRGGVVHGVPAVAEISDLPDDVDLAYVMVPTSAVLAVMQNIADHGIKNVVMLTAGFGEVGQAGADLEAELLDLAKARGLTLLGPNGNGYINATGSTCPYGLSVPKPLLRGGVGVVLQSGALVDAVMTYTRVHNIGISLMVAMGNETMIKQTDVMRYLIDDEQTKVIAIFIEAIRDPREFVAVARAALDAGKPIVALKVGRSQAGAKVAKAHTGALVGDDRIVDAVFGQCGVIRVNSLEDLVTTAGLMASTGPLPGPRLGIITASGGASEVLADRAEDEGLNVVDLAEETVDRLKEILPQYAAARNPIDATGYVVIDPTVMTRSLDAVLDDPGVDFALLMTPPELPREEVTGPDLDRMLVHHRRTAAVVAGAQKPVVVLNHTASDITAAGRDMAASTGYPHVVGGIEHGMCAIGNAVRWSTMRSRLSGRMPAAVLPRLVPGRGAETTWAEYRASNYLAANGIAVVPSALVSSAQDAVAVADDLGYPVVLKLAADDIEHKSDIGGVRLNLTSPQQVSPAFTEVTALGASAGASVVGALIQPQRQSGIELLVGIVHDPTWGLVLAVGLGGVWVEVLNDTALCVLPVQEDDVRSALLGLKGADLFGGARGMKPVDLDAVIAAILGIADLATRLQEDLESLEINPLLVTGSQVEALDALITWRAL